MYYRERNTTLSYKLDAGSQKSLHENATCIHLLLYQEKRSGSQECHFLQIETIYKISIEDSELIIG